jgi:hypothetical protein
MLVLDRVDWPPIQFSVRTATVALLRHFHPTLGKASRGSVTPTVRLPLRLRHSYADGHDPTPGGRYVDLLQILGEVGLGERDP